MELVMSIPDGFRPMLAINYDKVKTQPVVRYCSEKLDGVRCICFNGVFYSRSLKPLPNKQLQAYAAEYAEELEGFDGEIIVGNKYAIDVLQQTTSFVMSEDKVSDDWTYWVFDKYIENTPWIDRFSSIETSALNTNCQLLQHYPIHNEEYLSKFEKEILSKGGEGVMLRDALGQYKFGRSGTKTPELQKLKRFEDDEFEIVGYKQFETNLNELQRDERGYAKRSTSQQGKQLVEALGGLVCITKAGVEFNVGSGFTEQQRKVLWEEKDNLINKIAKVQFFGYSKDQVPLLPVFLAFRNTMDMS